MSALAILGHPHRKMPELMGAGKTARDSYLSSRDSHGAVLLAVDEVQERAEHRAGTTTAGPERAAARIIAQEQGIAPPFIFDDGVVELVTTERRAAGAQRAVNRHPR